MFCGVCGVWVVCGVWCARCLCGVCGVWCVGGVSNICVVVCVVCVERMAKRSHSPRSSARSIFNLNSLKLRNLIYPTCLHGA